jgi:hypothetical protein
MPMRPKIAGIVLLVMLVSGAGQVSAQHRVSREPALWPELQLDYVFKTTSFLYFRNHYRHVMDNDFNHLRETNILQYLERIQFRLGYEHVFNPNWSAGISEAYAIERTRNILFNEVYARHTWAIGKFRLTERATFEHIMRWPKNDNGRFRFRADLDRPYKIGATTLRPRASYELFFNIDYTPDPAAENRGVDRTRLRLDCQVVLSDHVAITPYFIRQSDYFLVEPAFDEDNNIIRDGGRQNHITPIWGLEARFSVFKGGASFPRNLPLNK